MEEDSCAEVAMAALDACDKCARAAVRSRLCTMSSSAAPRRRRRNSRHTCRHTRRCHSLQQLHRCLHSHTRRLRTRHLRHRCRTRRRDYPSARIAL